ncbi:SH3 domain-containing protein, partial [Bacillus sp. JCM 19041]|uniref:SH3 domain-containing protein n=1 Tax=Bacillus sp. JCM 19041 TaxID=1460637 RepID=UPI0012E21E6A
MPVGQKLELLKKDGNWYQVKAGSRTGWVSSDFIQMDGNGGNNVGQSPSIGSATTTARLNLRTGAGTNHRIVTTLPVGQKLELLKKDGNWYQVKAGSRTGWVSADFINLTSNTDKASSKAETVNKSGMTTARLNLRTGPSTSDRIVTTLNKGQELTINQKQNDWYQVTIGSQTGWVSAQYVTLSKEKQSIQAMSRSFSFSAFIDQNEDSNSSLDEDASLEDETSKDNDSNDQDSDSSLDKEVSLEDETSEVNDSNDQDSDSPLDEDVSLDDEASEVNDSTEHDSDLSLDEDSSLEDEASEDNDSNDQDSDSSLDEDVSLDDEASEDNDPTEQDSDLSLDEDS